MHTVEAVQSSVNMQPQVINVGFASLNLFSNTNNGVHKANQGAAG